jgi:hypothetical protein
MLVRNLRFTISYSFYDDFSLQIAFSAHGMVEVETVWEQYRHHKWQTYNEFLFTSKAKVKKEKKKKTMF